MSHLEQFNFREIDESSGRSVMTTLLSKSLFLLLWFGEGGAFKDVLLAVNTVTVLLSPRSWTLPYPVFQWRFLVHISELGLIT